MNEEISKQHTQLPNKMAENDLEPKDQLIYVVIKSFQNEKTKECFPSLQKIADKSNASIPTIRASIKRLEEKNYITIEKRGRSNYYLFNPSKYFEPFSPKFINKEDISFTTKSYLIASQQYMYKDIEGLGKISYSNMELSEKINMPESTIRKCNKELERNNYLTIIKNESRNIETGCKTGTKLFNLNELGQAVICALVNHEDRINDHEDRLSKLEEANKKKDLLIEKLLRENEDLKEKDKNTFVM